MEIDQIARCCTDAILRARKQDEVWTGKLRKPPEYLFTVAVAREISNHYEARCRITLEANAKEAIEDAMLERLSKKEEQEYTRKRLDVLLERVYKNTSYPWAIIEVKNGEYGFKGNVLEKDLDRLCRILSLDHWAIHYGVLVTYYVVRKRSSVVAQNSITRKVEERWDRIQEFVEDHYSDLHCKNYPSKIDAAGEESTSNFAWGVNVVRIGK